MVCRASVSLCDALGGGIQRVSPLHSEAPDQNFPGLFFFSAPFAIDTSKSDVLRAHKASTHLDAWLTPFSRVNLIGCKTSTTC